MKAVLPMIALLGLVACAEGGSSSGSGSSGPSRPDVPMSLEVLRDLTVYDVTYTPAGLDAAGPKVAVARKGGAFLVTDRDKALAVAQQFCDEQGKAPVAGATLIEARVDGVWEFVNLCR